MIVPVWSSETLTPTIADTLRAILNSEFPDQSVSFKAWRQGEDDKLLIFGSGAPESLLGRAPVEIVRTYSLAQVLSRPNAASVIASSIKNLMGARIKPNVRSHEDASWNFYPRKAWEVDKLVQVMKTSCGVEVRFDEPVAIDIETGGILGDTHTPDTVPILSVALYQDHWPQPIVFFADGGYEDNLTDHFFELLTKFEKGVYHNGKFDTRVLNRFTPKPLKVWFDTMLAHHVLNHAAREHGLKAVCQRRLGAPDWEGDIKQYVKKHDYSTIPMKKLVVYNGWDVVWTLELYKFLSPLIEMDEEAQKNLMFEQAVADFLLDVEVTGIPFNRVYADEYGDELLDETTAILERLEEVAGRFVNPNSPKHMKELFSELGYEIESSKEEVLSDLLLDNPTDTKLKEIVDMVLGVRERIKRRSTYVFGWGKAAKISDDGRVHPTYLVHGTTTGRLSSTAPNAQNMPRDKEVRKIVG